MDEERKEKESEKSFSIEVNGKKIKTKEELLLNALKVSGFDIPHLCSDDDFKPLANCRLCIVEADGRIVASCNTPIMDGMKIRTDTDEIREARRHNLELILSNHPLDCDYCYKNLHCELQSLAEKITKSTRYNGAKRQYGKDESSSSLSRNMDQCILCGRCIEACEKQGINILNYHLRGFSTIVAPAFNSKIADTPCISCGQCALHCPT
ncbi:MAG: 2Fe-2S iron-sulfur cluster-binding protein, partial [Candidatus Woesearchaeota archaeon]|nr:2Fe-2S iron-sulfur cluster-binding protein [Candidatus Woesearchaeota archaeon]